MKESRQTCNGKVTIRDIASYCGVSICSVSTVLHNLHKERRIPMDTVNVIREAVRKLGYVPDVGARRLRVSGGDKSPLVLALVSSYEAPLNLVNKFLYELKNIFEGDEEINARYEVSIVIEMFAAGKLSEKASFVSGNGFNAAIIMNTAPADDEFLKNTFLPFPSVLIGREVEGYSSVISTRDTGERAAKILLEKGRKRLGVLFGSPLTQTTKIRLEGFLKTAGNAVQQIKAAALSDSAGYDALREYLSGAKLDGLFCVSDSLALGAYLAIKRAGLKIPSDIAVVGIGDYEYSEYFDPPLTTVGISEGIVAREAGAMLLSQLKEGFEVPKIVSLPVRETLRTST